MNTSFTTKIFNNTAIPEGRINAFSLKKMKIKYRNSKYINKINHGSVQVLQKQ